MTKLNALLASLTLILGAACGQPPGNQGDSLQVISAAATKTAAAGTAYVEMDMDMQVMGQAIHISGTGESDVDSQQSHMTMVMESDSGDLPGLGEFEVVSDGTKVYMKYPKDSPGYPGSSGSKPWVMFDAAKAPGGGTFGGFGQPGSGDPSQYVEFLKGISGDIQTVGTEEVRGINTTHFSATMDFEKVLEQASTEQKGELGASLDQLRSQLGATEMPIDVWIGDDGLMRRMRLSFSTDGDAGDLSMQMDITVEMFDFGKPVHIEIPPASDVSDMGGMMGGATPSP